MTWTTDRQTANTQLGLQSLQLNETYENNRIIQLLVIIVKCTTVSLSPSVYSAQDLSCVFNVLLEQQAEYDKVNVTGCKMSSGFAIPFLSPTRACQPESINHFLLNFMRVLRLKISHPTAKVSEGTNRNLPASKMLVQCSPMPTLRATDQHYGQQDDANIRSYCVAVW